ncbi:Hypothetical predicted protein [Olea europaea subsp. europaea]|uniref:Uncharacterized protein n=1 Tax=Olea europaea subsp. europaea TaxID=158383 RepID=A0A8S0UNP0_OLEEU|nr:Hypothetical predicted protein [Olea europaea subsp. europaea]
MSRLVRWTSMPRVPRLQDEEDNGWTETGSEDTDISLSSEDNDRPDEHWNEIIGKHWNNEGWKKKSKLGRDNRLTVKSGTITKHTASSITIAAHKLRLYEKLGKPPTAAQLFERVHRQKKGEGDFVDNKSQMVYEKYENVIHDKYGSNVSSQPEIDIEAWCEASQGPSKGGRLYGLGIHYPRLHKVGISSPYDG